MKNESPKHFQNAPGLIGELADWIMENNSRCNPPHAVAAALSMAGALAGRNYKTKTGLHPSPWLVLLGSDLDFNLSSLVEPLHGAGAGDAVVNFGHTYRRPLLNTFAERPRHIWLWPFCGAGLKRMMRSKPYSVANSDARAALLSLTRDCESEHWRTPKGDPCPRPSLTILGQSTFPELFRQCDAGVLDDPLLCRFLFVPSCPRRLSDIRRDHHEKTPIPAHLSGLLYFLWLSGQPGAAHLRTVGGSLDMFPKFPQTPAPWRWAREHAAKIAALLAVVENPVEPEITPAQAIWAGDFVGLCVDWAVSLCSARGRRA